MQCNSGYYCRADSNSIRMELAPHALLRGNVIIVPPDIPRTTFWTTVTVLALVTKDMPFIVALVDFGP